MLKLWLTSRIITFQKLLIVNLPNSLDNTQVIQMLDRLMRLDFEINSLLNSKGSLRLPEI
jgi:hypothetical protein